MTKRTFINNIDIDDFLEFLYNEMLKKRYYADQSGSHTDGGAKELEAQIDVFTSGLNKVLPVLWEPYLKKYNLENDPDYQTYLKLKEKFE